MSVPRVSVLMPSYNGVRWIGQSLASLQAQTMADFEVVVVDDGSEPPTLDLLAAKAAEDPRIKVYRESHAGLIASLNKALGYAQAPYVARLDHDDIALPERFTKQAAFLDAHPDHLAVGCDLAVIDGEGRITKRPKPNAKKEPHDPFGFPAKPMWMPGPTLFARKEAMIRIGGFRPVCFAAEDRDVCWRLGAMGPTDRLTEVLVHWRDHGANTSFTRYRTQMASHAIGDLSAIARAHGLNDDAILADVVVGGDYRPTIERYETLIGDRYPVRTWWYYFLMRYRVWQLHGLASDADVVREIRSYCARNPLDWKRWKILRRTFLFERRDRSDVREHST